MSGKSLEGVPLFSGKMEVESIMEWIEGMENHFECQGVTEAQKVKVAKSRMRGGAVNWWNFIENEREREGSNDNIISEEEVSKLGLSSMPHSHPYKVTWLNKGQHVLVNEQVWVEFSIEKYSNRILCDVLPMDACHLLLGRPWQFDRKAIHDGEKNSYAFTKEGVTYRIQSLVEDEGITNSGPNVLLTGGNQFLRDLKKGDGEHYSLLVKPSQEKKTE
ncbi:hypothetical protein SUGI_0343200 [Cryptomeria japonica]|nr:hypothetical protein SUGI_0343200 [Cryptomeria japonica]